MHYRGTCFLILVCCLMVTCTEWISGTGSIIGKETRTGKKVVFAFSTKRRHLKTALIDLLIQIVCMVEPFLTK
jgi:hypothetical protein